MKKKGSLHQIGVRPQPKRTKFVIKRHLVKIYQYQQQVDSETHIDAEFDLKQQTSDFDSPKY